MRVDDALHVRPLLHDAQVERPFAGGLAAVGGVDDLALLVDGADVVKGDLRLGDLGGRDEDDVLIRAQGKVAPLAGHKAQLGKAVRRRHQLLNLRGILLLEIVHGCIMLLLYPLGGAAPAKRAKGKGRRRRFARALSARLRRAWKEPPFRTGRRRRTTRGRRARPASGSSAPIYRRRAAS